MSVDPLIQARTGDANRAWLRRGSIFRAAGRANIKGGSSGACSRDLVGYYCKAKSPVPRGTLYPDNRAHLARASIYAKHNPLDYVDMDTRRPCTEPSQTPEQLRYEETLRIAANPPPPPKFRLHVPGRGSTNDRAAGQPGPRNAMELRNGEGPSTPTNLVKMNTNFRCRTPFRGGLQNRPSSAPPGSLVVTPGVPCTQVPPGYTGYQPGLATAAGMRKSLVMGLNRVWVEPHEAWSAHRGNRHLVVRPRTSVGRARTSHAA